MKSFRRTFAEINLDALAHNWKFLQSEFQGCFLCPMVKANAYGHGDVIISKALESWGAQSLGVCLIEEALILRKFGIQSEILVFRGFDREGAEVLKAENLTPVVSTWEQLHILKELHTHHWKVHIKFDTGMNRLGFALEDTRRVFDFLQAEKRISVEGVLTHLVDGENAALDEAFSNHQLEKFFETTNVFSSMTSCFHALNSGGLLSQLLLRKQKSSHHPFLQKKWGLRPGLALYGWNPGVKENFSLQPVMKVKSTASVLRGLRPQQGVSYNHTWKSSAEAVIAVVPMGYADGYHRRLSNRGEALYKGKRVPVVGNVCMDYLMLDVTSVETQIKHPQVQWGGDDVVLLGGDSGRDFISAHELAEKADTIPWEILTSISERVPRQYIGKDAESLMRVNL